MARDLAHQILKPAAAAAGSADPAAKQLTEEGIKPAAKIIADAVQPVAKGFTDQTLLPTAQKVGTFHMPMVYAIRTMFLYRLCIEFRFWQNAEGMCACASTHACKSGTA